MGLAARDHLMPCADLEIVLFTHFVPPITQQHGRWLSKWHAAHLPRPLIPSYKFFVQIKPRLRFPLLVALQWLEWPSWRGPTPTQRQNNETRRWVFAFAARPREYAGTYEISVSFDRRIMTLEYVRHPGLTMRLLIAISEGAPAPGDLGLLSVIACNMGLKPSLTLDPDAVTWDVFSVQTYWEALRQRGHLRFIPLPTR